MERVLDAPLLNPEAAAFYEATKAGKFLIPRCKSCGKAHWYPRAYCPFCFGETKLEEASGDGVIYSYSVLRRVDPPYAIAYVTLAEGPTMMTNLVGCDFDDLKIGLPVKVVLTPTRDGPPVPCFTPV